MKGIPVLTASGQGIAEAWENSLVELHRGGCRMKTQYDRDEDPPSIDSTMIITIEEPLSEPMIHKDFPGGLDALSNRFVHCPAAENRRGHLPRLNSSAWPEGNRLQHPHSRARDWSLCSGNQECNSEPRLAAYGKSLDRYGAGKARAVRRTGYVKQLA